MSKLRKVVDAPEYARIVADRERVAFDGRACRLPGWKTWPGVWMR
ncbi:MAG: hypothetical protein R8F89_01995 [Roseobacter sp.]|nr:hypothetical protein [Roseobacter sp.]